MIQLNEDKLWPCSGRRGLLFLPPVSRAAGIRGFFERRQKTPRLGLHRAKTRHTNKIGSRAPFSNRAKRCLRDFSRVLQYTMSVSLIGYLHQVILGARRKRETGMQRAES